MATPLTDQREVVDFLSRLESYGLQKGAVECYRTHGAMVFLAGDRAYKLKRAVRYPYMDYSTPERRFAMCERELAVNRHAAPMLYLGVQPIVRTEECALCFGAISDKLAAIDWVVVMRRFEQENLFGEMQRAGKLTRLLMCSLAEVIVDFHRGAEVHRDYGGVVGIRTVIDENTDILTARIGQPFSAERVATLATRSRDALSRVSGLLERRREHGHIRRCHGDLHLNNICMIEGQPVLFDAIEFSDQIACIDVLYDLAFLLMDLDRTGSRAHANTALNRYLELTGEHAGLAALPLFLSCRAAIRAHVSAAAIDASLRDGKISSGYEEAAAFVERAIGYLTVPAPRLIAVGGVSGTGKSTLARHLAPFTGAVPGAVIIRSDIIRKQLIGAEETTRLGPSAYTAAVSERVYSRMMKLASETLEAGHAAIVDGVFGRNVDRSRIAEVARGAKASFAGIWLEAPEETLRRRICGRTGDASDATVAVLQDQLASVETPKDWRRLDADLSEEQACIEALAILGTGYPLLLVDAKLNARPHVPAPTRGHK